MMSSPKITHLPVSLDSVVDAVSGASVLAKRYFGSAAASPRLKADATVVTRADIEIDVLLRKSLLDLLPGAGWLSEERADDADRLGREFVWIVDPLDGTKEFACGIPETAVSVGLCRDGRPVLGVVVNPIRNEGGAASVWEKPRFWGLASRPAPAELREMSVCVSRTEFEKGLAAPFSRLQGLAPVGSVAYKLLRVAAGADHLYISVEPKSEWDICGGVALLELSGACYRRFDGRPNAFNAARPRILCGAAAGPQTAVERFLREFASDIAPHAGGRA